MAYENIAYKNGFSGFRAQKFYQNFADFERGNNSRACGGV
jgi:hypothetical protein